MLKLKVQRQQKSQCSLDPFEFPGIKTKFPSGEKFYPDETTQFSMNIIYSNIREIKGNKGKTLECYRA